MTTACWVLKTNPFHADRSNKYPEMRFYTETLVGLAMQGLTRLDVIWLDSDRPDDTRLHPDGDTRRFLDLMQQHAPTCRITIWPLSQALQAGRRYDLGILAIIAHVQSKKDMARWVDLSSQLAGLCDNLIYGDSDLELSPDHLINHGAGVTGMMEALAAGKAPEVLTKLRAVFVVEHPKHYRALVQQKVDRPVVFLPRLGFDVYAWSSMLPATFAEKAHDWAFIKYFDKHWKGLVGPLGDRHPHWRLHWHLSPFPPSFKLESGAIDGLGNPNVTYGKARNWTQPQLRVIARSAKFLPNAARPINRFTSKFYEALTAGSCTPIPYLWTKDLVGEDGDRQYAEAYYTLIRSVADAPVIDWEHRRLTAEALDVLAPFIDNEDRYRGLYAAQIQFHNDYASVRANYGRLKRLLEVSIR